MFRITIEEGKPERAAFILCDNPRCMKFQAMGIPPGLQELAAIQTFFNAMTKQQGWLILPHGHYCPDHKQAFMGPAPQNMVVPVTATPQRIR